MQNRKVTNLNTSYKILYSEINYIGYEKMREYYFRIFEFLFPRIARSSYRRKNHSGMDFARGIYKGAASKGILILF